MEIYAAIDTNVLLSALLSKNEDSATVKVLDAVFEGKIIPLYHEDILIEYNEVLHREKFHLREEVIQTVLDAVRQYGIPVFPQSTGAVLIDMNGLIFYEVVMEKRDDVYEMLADMMKLLEDNEASWTVRKEILDEMLGFAASDNSGFTNYLMDIAVIMCMKNWLTAVSGAALANPFFGKEKQRRRMNIMRIGRVPRKRR